MYFGERRFVRADVSAYIITRISNKSAVQYSEGGCYGI